MLQSIFVGKAAYDSEWYLIKSKSFKKSISIIMARCNRPAKITFGKFADLSMDSFASVSIIIMVIINIIWC